MIPLLSMVSGATKNVLSAVLMSDAREHGLTPLVLVFYNAAFSSLVLLLLWLAPLRPQQTRRLVEGSGPVDYINIIWCAPSSMALYREATRAHGLCEYEWGADGEVWDAFWYIYKRNLKTPSYAHIGLDTSASLVQQGHVTGEVKACLRGAWESSMQEHDQAGGKKPKGGKKGECAVQ